MGRERGEQQDQRKEIYFFHLDTTKAEFPYTNRFEHRLPRQAAETFAPKVQSLSALRNVTGLMLLITVQDDHCPGGQFEDRLIVRRNSAPNNQKSF
jgi:hypothetical protein